MSRDFWRLKGEERLRKTRVEEARAYVSKFLPSNRIDVGAMCAISLAEVHGRGKVTKQMILDRLDANYPWNPAQTELEL